MMNNLNNNQTNIAGGIVINPKKGIAIVNQNHDSWSLPKGHVEDNETLVQAAIREIYQSDQKKYEKFKRVPCAVIEEFLDDRTVKEIENVHEPDRKEWCNRIAFYQWTNEELADVSWQRYIWSLLRKCISNNKK